MDISCAMKIALILLLSMACSTIGQAAENDTKILLEGVKKIASPGVPGPLCVFSEGAFAVVAGGTAGNLYEPVVAAGRMGNGRVVAFGHTGYLDANSLKTADTDQLMLNSVKWAANNDSPRVALYRRADLVGFFQQQGIEAKFLDGDGWLEKLNSFDILCVQTSSLSLDTEVPAIQEFIRQGGGLIAGDLGWGWSQLNPGKNLVREHPGNPLLTPAGIVWADGYLNDTAENGFSVDGVPSELCHATLALDALIEYSKEKIKLEEEEIEQASRIVSRAIRSLPLEDEMLLPNIRSWQQRQSTEGTPMERIALTLQLSEIEKLPPDKIEAHPMAEDFPGIVPENAKRIRKIIEIDTSIPDWHSTGLYAAPGELIKIEVPEEATGKNLKIRIGAHSDRLWDKKEWKRSPDICRIYHIENMETGAANAFGGLIYVVVPRKCELGKISVKISGAVEAPYYIFSQTDLTEWREKIRHYPAPWAELATDKVIITVPSEAARKLDEPEELMNFWNEVLDACAELGARPLKRTRPERYVTDKQISAGYMHAGYPLMTHLDVANVLLDKTKLMTNEHGGVWGLYHEMGHNHQVRDWTFSGTGEVTVNLFTLYVFDTVCGMKPKALRSFNEEGRAKMLKEYFDSGGEFDMWKRRPFLALLMYIQMQEEFGWDVFRSVFAEYRDLSPEERPKNDDESRDQWMVRFSRTAGHNLRPFFEAWGVPTSEASVESIADLPVWMPANFLPTKNSTE